MAAWVVLWAAAAKTADFAPKLPELPANRAKMAFYSLNFCLNSYVDGFDSLVDGLNSVVDGNFSVI
ncbi:MAG: hypothetical protein ACR2QC_06725 [Gammaproteobacteria bacterium]